MIHPNRLSKYIASREWQHSRDYMLGLYGAMTKEQRLEIKNILIINSKKDYERNTQGYNKR